MTTLIIDKVQNWADDEEDCEYFGSANEVPILQDPQDLISASYPCAVEPQPVMVLTYAMLLGNMPSVADRGDVADLFGSLKVSPPHFVCMDGRTQPAKAYDDPLPSSSCAD